MVGSVLDDEKRERQQSGEEFGDSGAGLSWETG
jgi:hypothetical protein